MPSRLLSKRTLTNMGSNIAPVLILATFIGLFLTTTPWNSGLFIFVLSLVLTVVPLSVLVLITLLTRQKFAMEEETDEDVLPP